MSKATNPLDTQVGGNHYKDMKIQPFEFSMANNFNAGQHSVVKYVSRYKTKNGKEDLLKARHFIDLMIQVEYPEPEQKTKRQIMIDGIAGMLDIHPDFQDDDELVAFFEKLKKDMLDAKKFHEQADEDPEIRTRMANDFNKDFNL